MIYCVSCGIKDCSVFYDLHSMIFFAGFQPDLNCSYRVDDMVLTKKQMQEAFGDFDLSDRSGINDADFRWKDNKLPYVFDKSIETKDQLVVKKTINRFNKEMMGCLEIVYVYFLYRFQRC